MSKRTILFFIILFLLFSSSLLLFSPALAEEEAITIAGISVTKESEEEASSYLSKHQWEKLPADFVSSGLINNFAVAGSNRCAVSIDNEIYVFIDNARAAGYRFVVSGSFHLFSDNDDFYIYDVRNRRFVCFNEADGVTAVYRIGEESLRKNSGRLGHLGDCTAITVTYDNGDYLASYSVITGSIEMGNYAITNTHPRITPVITKTYDTLLWKNDNEESVLYSSNERQIMLTVLLVGLLISLIAGIIMLVLLITAKKRDMTLKQLWESLFSRRTHQSVHLREPVIPL